MKLLAKYNRINILVTISVLLISSICFYIMIRHVLLNQLDEDLKVEEQEIIDFVKTNNKLPDPSSYEDQQIEFKTANDNSTLKKFSSVKLNHKTDNEEELYRQYEFNIAADGKYYKVDVRKSQEETEDLIKMIALVTLGIVVLLLLILFLINIYFFKINVW